MKSLLVAALLAPALMLAQAAPTKPAAKTASTAKTTKATKTASSKKSAPTKVAKKAPTQASSKTKLALAGAGVGAAGLVGAGALAASPTVSPSAALDTEVLAIAEQVHTGHMACELGAAVNVEADSQSPGRFYVHGKGFRYHMTPVASATGAVRLEDVQRGAVWLQIANKSMLMNQKLGQRLADECMSPAQFEVAQAMKVSPPPNLLDKPAPAAQ